MDKKGPLVQRTGTNSALLTGITFTKWIGKIQAGILFLYHRETEQKNVVLYQNLETNGCSEQTPRMSLIGAEQNENREGAT